MSLFKDITGICKQQGVVVLFFLWGGGGGGVKARCGSFKECVYDNRNFFQV